MLEKPDGWVWSGSRAELLLHEKSHQTSFMQIYDLSSKKICLQIKKFPMMTPVKEQNLWFGPCSSSSLNAVLYFRVCLFLIFIWLHQVLVGAFLVAQLVKNLPEIRETWIWSLGWEDSPGEGKNYPFQYSGLENSMDCIVHGVAESQTWLVTFISLQVFVVICGIFSCNIWDLVPWPGINPAPPLSPHIGSTES